MIDFLTKFWEVFCCSWNRHSSWRLVQVVICLFGSDGLLKSNYSALRFIHHGGTHFNFIQSCNGAIIDGDVINFIKIPAAAAFVSKTNWFKRLIFLWWLHIAAGSTLPEQSGCKWLIEFRSACLGTMFVIRNLATIGLQSPMHVQEFLHGVPYFSDHHVFISGETFDVMSLIFDMWLFIGCRGASSEAEFPNFVQRRFLCRCQFILFVLLLKVSSNGFWQVWNTFLELVMRNATLGWEVLDPLVWKYL